MAPHAKHGRTQTKNADAHGRSAEGFTRSASGKVPRCARDACACTPRTTRDGVLGEFTDVIAGFHHAPSGDPIGGKGNVAFLDGHIAPHAMPESFALAWPY